MSQTDSYYCALLDVLTPLALHHESMRKTLERPKKRGWIWYADVHCYYARVMRTEKHILYTVESILKLFDEWPQR